MNLAIELGEGFTDDDVVVLVDGKEAWRRSGVTTNYSVGLAAIAEVPAAPGTTVEVRVRGMSRTERVEHAPLRTFINPDGLLAITEAPGGTVF